MQFFTPRKLVLPLLFLGAAAVVLLGGLGFYRKVQTFQPTGLETEKLEEGWLVTSAAQGVGLNPGDLLLLVNGELIADREDLEGQLLRRPESNVLVMDGGDVRSVIYRRPDVEIDFAYLLLALSGVVYLLIGFYTLTREQTRPVTLFFVWCLSSAAVYLLSPRIPPLDFADQAIYVTEELARLLVPALTLHFFLLFPRPITEAVWLRRCIPFLYLAPAVLMSLQLDLILYDGALFAGPPTEAKIAALDLFELYLLVICAFGSILLLLSHLLRARRWEEGRQVLWITLGMAGGYVPFLALYLLPTSLGLEAPDLVAILAVAPLGLVPLSFAYAILRYRLWDIAIIVRDVATYTLTLLLGIFGFSLLNLLIHRGIPEDFAVARSVMTFLAGLLMAGLLIPTRNSINSTLQRFHYRSSFRRRRALSQFGHDLLHERDLERLSFSLLQELEEALDLEHCNLYLVEEGRLEPIKEDESPTELDLERIGEEIWQEEVEILADTPLPDVERSPSELLVFLGYRYVFPLKVRDRRVGLFLASYKAGHIPLTSDDRMLIRQLLNQVALAIENAQLVETLQRQLSEVQELKQFNEEIIESSPAGIAVLDARQRVVSANLAFAATVGVERSAARRRPLQELLPVESLPTPEEGLVEVSFRDRHGHERFLQLSGAAFLGNPREALTVLVVHDVTDRVLMERTLEEKERLAALGVMAAGVAHEVNTPLTGISSYAQMLLSDTDPQDPRYPLLQKVERQTFRAARIVNNLLEFARSRETETHPVPVERTVAECLEFLEERLDEHAIELRFTPPDDSALVNANENELHQVFNNLLVNAIDAMEEEGGILTVSLRSEGDWVIVDIRDTGCGIPQEHLSQIFQPFFSTKVQSGGTGLGLSLSVEMVRRYNGEIVAKNNEEQGSCFSVKLPRARSAGASRGGSR